MDEHDFYGEDPRADFGHRSKAAYWTVEEGIALSYGRNPRIVNWAFLSASSEHPFALNYAGRLDLGLRAKAVGQLRDVNEPAAFISWTKRVAFEFPPELANAVQLRFVCKTLAGDSEFIFSGRSAKKPLSKHGFSFSNGVAAYGD